jgi:hypothetical protein
MSLAIDKQDSKNGEMPEIVISNVPEVVYQRLRERAEHLDLSLEEFLLQVITDESEFTQWSQIFEDMAPYRTSNFTHEDLIRAIDESREERENRVFFDNE